MRFVAGPPYEDLAFRIVNKVTVKQRERETDTQKHRQEIERVTKSLAKETMYVKRDDVCEKKTRIDAIQTTIDAQRHTQGTYNNETSSNSEMPTF